MILKLGWCQFAQPGIGIVLNKRDVPGCLSNGPRAPRDLRLKSRGLLPRLFFFFVFSATSAARGYAVSAATLTKQRLDG